MASVKLRGAPVYGAVGDIIAADAQIRGNQVEFVTFRRADQIGIPHTCLVLGLVHIFLGPHRVGHAEHRLFPVQIHPVISVMAGGKEDLLLRGAAVAEEVGKEIIRGILHLMGFLYCQNKFFFYRSFLRGNGGCQGHGGIFRLSGDHTGRLAVLLLIRHYGRIAGFPGHGSCSSGTLYFHLCGKVDISSHIVGVYQLQLIRRCRQKLIAAQKFFHRNSEFSFRALSGHLDGGFESNLHVFCLGSCYGNRIAVLSDDCGFTSRGDLPGDLGTVCPLGGKGKALLHGLRQGQGIRVCLNRRGCGFLVHQILIGQSPVINFEIVNPAFVSLSVYPVGSSDIKDTGISQNIGQGVVAGYRTFPDSVYIQDRFRGLKDHIDMSPVCACAFLNGCRPAVGIVVALYLNVSVIVECTDVMFLGINLGILVGSRVKDPAGAGLIRLFVVGNSNFLFACQQAFARFVRHGQIVGRIAVQIKGFPALGVFAVPQFIGAVDLGHRASPGKSCLRVIEGKICQQIRLFLTRLGRGNGGDISPHHRNSQNSCQGSVFQFPCSVH